MKINIAYIIPSLDVGGSEQKVIDLSNGLDRIFFNPIIITITKEGSIAYRAKELGIPLFCVNKKGKFDLGVVRRIARVLKNNNIDIVHVYTSTGKLWGRLGAIKANVRVIISTEESLFRNKFIDRFLERMFVRRTNLIITNSNATLTIAATSTKIASTKYKVIHNGLVLEPFINAKNLKFIPKHNDELIIMCVARLDPRKRHDLLIDAFYDILDVVNAKLVIVGGGPLEHTLKSYVKELKIEDKVLFLGVRNDVPSLLKEADIFVLPSSEEGFGNVIIEASAAKVCVVASNVGGIPEIIEHNKNGMLFESGNKEALINTLLKVINDEELRNKLANEAFKNASKFSQAKMVEEHVLTYKTLLGEGNSL